MSKTKLYQVLDDAQTVLYTTDKIKAALALYDLAIKYEDKQSWFNVLEGDLE
jgi:hypothetical protein